MTIIPCRKYLLPLLLAWAAIFSCILASAANIHYTMPAGVKLQSPSIQRVRGVDAPKLLAQTVTVEGYYYDGSIPMVIDDINRVMIDLPLPEESFVPVVGAIPATLKSGDRVSVSGMLFNPTNGDPPAIRGESTAIRITDAGKIKVLQASTLPQLTLPAVGGDNAPNVPPPTEKTRYAVLIAGCANPSNNHVRYWNDLVTMYHILIGRGFQPGNIFVLYADGAPRPGSSKIPVNYSATSANITTVFNQLAAKITAKDDVYIMLNDHGGGLLTKDSAGHPAGYYGGCINSTGSALEEKYNEVALDMDLNYDGKINAIIAVSQVLCLWNWENMTDDQFAVEVNKVSKAKTIVIQMKQCFCGGFINNLRGKNRIIMSSCSPDEFSWGTNSNKFGVFTYWYFAALSGYKPDGSGPVNADTNFDGKVSIVEAYNFARSHDSAPETPYYEENDLPFLLNIIPAGMKDLKGEAYFL